MRFTLTYSYSTLQENNQRISGDVPLTIQTIKKNGNDYEIVWSMVEKYQLEYFGKGYLTAVEDDENRSVWAMEFTDTPSVYPIVSKQQNHQLAWTELSLRDCGYYYEVITTFTIN